jgi:hypothetical protein
LAQLAALRAQLKVKDMGETASKVKGKKKDDDTADIMFALTSVWDARKLVDNAHGQIKAGGDTLKDALDAANSLQAKLKTASAKADEVEKALKAVTDNKVSEQLQAALKALGETITTEPNADSQAQALVDAMDQIANPLLNTESKAKEFQEKVEEINKKAVSGAQTDVPQEVKDAETIFTALTALAQEAQTRIKADTSLEDATDDVNELVKLLTHNGEDKPKKILADTRLKARDQWIAVGEDNKAKAYGDAQKLAEQAKQILDLTQAGAKAVKKARSKATSASAHPALTMEVLEVILVSLERNPNLRRIQRYLTLETEGVPKMECKYITNLRWLGE